MIESTEEEGIAASDNNVQEVVDLDQVEMRTVEEQLQDMINLLRLNNADVPVPAHSDRVEEGSESRELLLRKAKYFLKM